MSHAVKFRLKIMARYFLNFDQVESVYFGSGEIWPRGIFGTFV